MNKNIFKISLALIFIYNVANADNQMFQNMDNQIGLGISYNKNNAYNPNTSLTQISTNSTAVNLNIEDLFDNNMWLNLNSQFALQASTNNNGVSQLIQQFGFPASLFAKGGYSFNWSNIGLQIIPYVSAGHMLNYNGQSLLENGFANSSYNAFGGGARIEYIFVPNASVYFDQNISYLQDPNAGVYNQDALSYTSELGIRYNPLNYLQLSLIGSFNQTNTTNSSLGFSDFNLSYQNTNQSMWSGMFMVSYLFDNNGGGNSIEAPSDKVTNDFMNFDNNFSLGMGFVGSRNSYSNGSLPTIDTSLNYYSLSITHLFNNGVWANLGGQLINNISQTNATSTGLASTVTPTYLGFPGNAYLNLGYAIPLTSASVQVIPYANLGLVSNINSYNVRSNDNLISAVAEDKAYQYGFGGRVEYNVNQNIQLYFDQLVSYMDDQSGANLNTLNSDSKIGALFNVWDRLQLGVDGFYSAMLPTGSTSNNGIDYAINQNSLGLELNVGFRY